MEALALSLVLLSEKVTGAEESMSQVLPPSRPYLTLPIDHPELSADLLY
jgi:hypothetical protein